jgi:uncharacterized SAM-binding protein YcdF (DUF218 family)
VSPQAGSQGKAKMRPMYLQLKQLLLPPASPLLLAFVGLALLAAGRRSGRWLTGIGLLLAWLLSCEGFVDPLARWYARAPAPAVTLSETQAWAGRSDAVVLVLGGGIRDGGAADGGFDLQPLTAERLRRGQWWAARLRLPLAFSGGPTGQGEHGVTTEAAVAARVLADTHSAPMLWLEDQAMDTRGNAHHAARHLQRHGTRAVILVTHDLHMPRALKHFRQAAPGVLFIPAPLQRLPSEGHRSSNRIGDRLSDRLGDRLDDRLGDWLPSVQGSARGHYLVYEILGRLAGR